MAPPLRTKEIVRAHGFVVLSPFIVFFFVCLYFGSTVFTLCIFGSVVLTSGCSSDKSFSVSDNFVHLFLPDCANLFSPYLSAKLLNSVVGVNSDDSICLAMT